MWPNRKQQTAPTEDLYDLLRAIIHRTPWRNEDEARRYRELIDRLQEVNVFGYLASQIKTEGDGVER